MGVPLLGNGYIGFYGILYDLGLGVPKIEGNIFGGPHTKDYNILGSILGFGVSGNYQIDPGMPTLPMNRRLKEASKLTATSSTPK